MMKPKPKERPRHCGHKVMMRVQRARRAHREMSAQGAAVQLLAIFTALVTTMPLLPSPRASSSGSGEPEGSAPAASPPAEIYMSGDEAMAFIRRHKPMRESARLSAARAALMRDIPEAADWIKDAFNFGEWSDLLRCDVPGNLPATARAMNARAEAWRLDRKSSPPVLENANDRRP